MLLTYTNDNGQSISFTNHADLRVTSILLTDADGLHGLPVEVHVLTQYGQDGATYVDNQLPPRHVTLGCKIVRNVVETRLELLRIMHPKIQGTLTLSRGRLVRRLRCAIEQAPAFAPKNGNVFSVGLIAPNPYWLDETQTRADIATWLPAFEWPLDIPEDGISFGERSASLITNITNAGDATVGMQVVFSATQDVINPSLTNIITFERMRALTTLHAGDRLVIATGYGEKQATIQRAGQAEPVNAMTLLDITDANFSFLQLAPGDNILRYDADDGAAHLNVSLYYAPGYLGV